jgi:hypothetical protein
MQTHHLKEEVLVGRTIRQLVILVAVGAAFTGTLFAAAPSITSLSPTAGRAGTPVIITGTNFGLTQDTSTVQFNGKTATTISSWSSSLIKAVVPAGATTGKVVVTVGGVASNGVSFTVEGGHIR